MKTPCPDCGGRGTGCLTCKGHGEWTCPLCGFRVGQNCEQLGVPVPCPGAAPDLTAASDAAFGNRRGAPNAALSEEQR